MSTGRVVVTGGAGFIGSHLARHLHQRGHDVLAIDVRQSPPALFGARGPRYATVDIRDADMVSRALEGADVVFHLASVHLEVRASADAFAAVNVRAVEDLVEASARAGVRRFVHTSSVGIYGHVTQPPAREESPVNPVSPYERSKLAGERAALARAAQVGLDLIIVRPAWVYGPGCPRTAKLIRSLRKQRFLYVGRGANLRHPIYIDDMVEAFERAADAAPDLAGRAFIAAGPRALPLRDLVNTFARALEVPPPRLALPRSVGWALGVAGELAFGAVGRDAPFSRRSLAFFENDNAFDGTAARRALGFEPRIDLEEGARRTVSALGMAGAA